MAKPARKVIITCAVTGAIHTPTMSDALPYKPEDTARQSIEAAQAGAAILHLRHPEGRHSCDPCVHYAGDARGHFGLPLAGAVLNHD